MMSVRPSDAPHPDPPAPAFLNLGSPEDAASLVSLPGPEKGGPLILTPSPPAGPGPPPEAVKPPWRCPLSLMLALVSGLPICVVGFLAWGIPFLNLTTAIDPLSHSIRTLVFAILERDLTLTWDNMRALAMAQRRLWDVGGQPTDAYAEAESLTRMIWPILESNEKLVAGLVFTANGGLVHEVAPQRHPELGLCISVQNGTHRWFMGWDFERNRFGAVLRMMPLFDPRKSVAVVPINQTTPQNPFAWLAVYNPQLNYGNLYSANVGLFDAQGEYFGRFAVSMSTMYLAHFLSDQLASQPATRGGRLALYDELGLVVAASHGAADLNRRYALAEVGDPDLEAAGRLLAPLTLTGGWCPTNTSLDVSFSIRYFLDVRLFEDTNTAFQPLRWCAVLLSPRENTMQYVDRSVSFAAAFVCGMTFGATALAMALGFVVTRPIQRLTTGMSALKACRFPEARRATGRKSVFSELFVAQGSYDSLVEAIDAFGKYVPATVVRGLLAGTIRPKLGMTEKDVVLAFMDVENFTHLCETNPVEDIVSVTCRLFDLCCDIILQSQGTVDKFIGDCIMAMWGAPTPLPHPEANAVEALLEVLRMLRCQPMKCGDAMVGLLIGAHGGRCLVGNFGATARWDYTAVGDVVNAAARLGPLNKQFQTHCLVSGALHDHPKVAPWAARCMRPMGDAVVVGKRKALAVYEVREQPVADRDAWAEAVRQFSRGQLDAAAEYFRSLPDDAGARAFLEDVQRTPPGGPFHRTMRSK
eukprot:EG_transcript_1943